MKSETAARLYLHFILNMLIIVLLAKLGDPVVRLYGEAYKSASSTQNIPLLSESEFRKKPLMPKMFLLKIMNKILTKIMPALYPFLKIAQLMFIPVSHRYKLNVKCSMHHQLQSNQVKRTRLKITSMN